MKKQLGALALSVLFLLSSVSGAFAAQLGPASSYEELLSLAAGASNGDTLLVSGAITALGEEPFTSQERLLITGIDDACISGLQLHNANVVFSSLTLKGGLHISGTSHVQLTRGVAVLGADGDSGIRFFGNGSLLLDPGSSVAGGAGATGVAVSHGGGDLYVSIDGDVHGGAGDTGGAAAVIDPLGASGALMVTGRLTGGKGEAFGGNALNLHNLTGNAFITVDGRLTGGEGSIGGSGLQLITAEGSVTAGIGGRINGGRGHDYGGDAMLLMNIGGSATVSLFGSLTGGDSSGTNSTPGQSLKLLGKTTAMRTMVGECIFEEGRQVLTAISVTPLPAITSSVDDAQTLETPSPTVEPTTEPTPEPTAEPTAEPTQEPTVEPTAEPTQEPTAEPTAEPTQEPTSEPTPEPTAEPSDETEDKEENQPSPSAA